MTDMCLSDAIMVGVCCLCGEDRQHLGIITGTFRNVCDLAGYRFDNTIYVNTLLNSHYRNFTQLRYYTE
jgi:hypothetical protein